MASGELLLFYRELREERVLIALNTGPEPIAVSSVRKECLAAFFYLHLQTAIGERQF
ncbi:hypothetical protein [Bradyrhizobium sp. AUGA SZCCT0042]|uniref:hypothetical protein n=1 Tax=Bradyrhizobium sp. AUGA SZCCT0042 TaxID=2807651 RepID=UPI001BAB538F|nr:hypothetical protein [Bradyrhizobium sp. AUGA SZCCT0042]MBR1300612.1 hypothetical protein [Bradyrhizobium sp. AUGA SZCCT0042]